jgi:hypothetical protein
LNDSGRPRWLVALTFPPAVNSIEEGLMAAQTDQRPLARRGRSASALANFLCHFQCIKSAQMPRNMVSAVGLEPTTP